MASATASPRSDEGDLELKWSRRWSLTHRILAVNILALAMLAGGFFYLDSYRDRLLDQRAAEVAEQAHLIAEASNTAPVEMRQALLTRMGTLTGLRLRVYPAGGTEPRFDTWEQSRPTYRLRDPEGQPWQRQAARTLDRIVNFVAGAKELAPFEEPARDRLAAWPEAVAVTQGARQVTEVRQARDLTPVISSAVPIQRVDPAAAAGGGVLLATINARDVTRIVRDERMRLGFVLLGATILSVLLSLFLARTIARPLRRLARAAQRVRLGRSREVDVPRLPARRDEIGLLARALHDMTHSLRYRIDATEAFAADVTHELKNPLASLRSAVDSLERVEQPELRRQLLDVVRNDVVRLDRLIVDIAEISRLDAELTRARFEPIDLAVLIEELLPGWEQRAEAAGAHVVFARPLRGAALMMGEASRLARALDNLVDNAISFSPPDGNVELAAVPYDGELMVSVEDEGPGVPHAQREAIFNRFHSIRPDGEAFGRHSGLGLAIARAIVEGHDGTISVEDRRDGRAGARFVLRFPGGAAS
jgi:two-component system, OmpR family, sensor histidine kinase ChvG